MQRRSWNSGAVLVGMRSDAATMGNSMAVPQKTKHGITISSSNSASTYLPPKNWERDSDRCLHTHVSSNVVHNS